MNQYFGRLMTKNPYTFLPMSPGESFENMPPDWGGSGTITISMAGARSSGKSLYIAVIVKLLHDMLVKNGGTFHPATEETRTSYKENYEDQLFGKMGLLGATPPMSSKDAPQRTPLIFDMGHHRRGLGPDASIQKIYLVLRDVAGEDLKEENFGERADALSFFSASDLVVYLFDPMSVPQIGRLLEGIVPKKEIAEDNPVAILRNVLEVLGTARGQQLAIALSKFDTMQELGKLSQIQGRMASSQSVDWQKVMSNLGASFQRDSGPVEAPYDENDAALLDAEVKSLLQCLNSEELLNQLNTPLYGEAPYTYRCFVVSALGAQPEGDRVSRTGIAPFRCLDPIRYLFARFGIIPLASHS